MFVKRKKLDRKRLSTLFTVLMIMFMMVSSVFTSKLIVAEDTETDVILLCEKEEHTHDETCFDEEENLICEKEEHTHGDECFEQTSQEQEEQTETEEVNNEEEADTSKEEEPENDNGLEENELNEDANEENTPEQEEINLDSVNEDSVALLVPVYYCEMTEHVHSETCFNEEGEIVCEHEEHHHTKECLEERQKEDDQVVEAINKHVKAFALLKGVGSYRIPPVGLYRIPSNWLVTKNRDEVNHTYVVIGSDKYTLTNDGFTPKIDEEQDLSVDTSVRMSLLFEIADKDISDQTVFYYELPENLTWDKKEGFVLDATDRSKVLGSYEISGNKVFIRYNKEFIEESKKTSQNIRTRVYADGHVKETDPSGETGGTKYKFTDDFEIGPFNITNEASLQLNKRTATTYDVEKPIIMNEDGSVTITYILEIKTAGTGSVTDIKIEDTLVDELNLGAKYVDGSLKFGSQPDSDNFGSGTADITIPGTTYTINSINFGSSRTNFTFVVNKWNSKEGPSPTLYVTYKVQFVPKRFGTPSDPQNKITYVKVGNNVNGEYKPSEGEDPKNTKTTNEFVYKNALVDKTGAKNNSESYVADWTATFNNYEPLYGAKFFDGEGHEVTHTTIKDSLKKETEATSMHSPYLVPSENPANFTITVYEPNDEQTGYKSSKTIKTEADFETANMFKADGTTPITSLNEFIEAYFGDGVSLPIRNKYVIKYQTKLNEGLIPTDSLEDVKINNEASNGGDDTPGSPGKESEEVGVGPAKPTIKKDYKAGTSASDAVWEVVLEIKDEKYQTDGYIYDYISKLHSIDTDVPINFSIEDNKGSVLAPTPFTWDSDIVDLEDTKYIDNGDEKLKNEDGTYNTNFEYNFRFNVIEAINSSLADDGEKKAKVMPSPGKLAVGYKFKISYKTNLQMNKGDAVSNDFSFTNYAFVLAKDGDKDLVIDDSANTIRNIINKQNLDTNKALYQRAYNAAFDKGDREFGFKDMPWFMSCLVMDSNLILSDAYHTDLEKGYGDMLLDESSVAVFYTEKAKPDGDISSINWSDPEQATLLKKGPDYTISPNNADGFKVNFKNLKTTDNSRVVVFYVTVAQTYDNDVIYRYENTVVPEGYGSGETGPKATSYTTRRYEILDKTGILVDEPEDVDATYTINVNKVRMKLNNGKLLKLEDTLSDFLNYAGGFEFYEVLPSGEEVLKINGEDGYSVDVSSGKVLKITIPDETYVKIKYNTAINQFVPNNENLEVINTVDLHGESDWEVVNVLKVYVVEHEAIAWLGDGHLRLRVLKYDRKRTTKVLPETKFFISEYILPEAGKELVPVDLDVEIPDLGIDDPDNPGDDPDDPDADPVDPDPYGTIYTNTDGQFLVEKMHYNHIYKLEEVEPLPGYAPLGKIYYLCFAQDMPEGTFEGLTINGKPVEITIVNKDDPTMSEYYLLIANDVPTPPGRRIPKTGD